MSARAAIVFAPTVIGTVYGMNFATMPGLDQSWGFPVSALILMLGVRDEGGKPIGAVLVADGTVLGVGRSRVIRAGWSQPGGLSRGWPLCNGPEMTPKFTRRNMRAWPAGWETRTGEADLQPRSEDD